MERFGRWTVAAAVTLTSFAAVTWICGALLLAPWLKDPASRWGLAGAAGVALAALAALWGKGFATRTGEATGPGTPDGVVVQATGARAVAVHGNPTGAISTGDTAAPGTPAGATSGRQSSPPPAASATPSVPGQGRVAASGERSIAINGNPQGAISTGDHLGGTPV